MLLPAVLGLGATDRVAALLEAMTNLHDHHERDAGESIFAAHEAGTYTKVRLCTAVPGKCASGCKATAAGYQPAGVTW